MSTAHTSHTRDEARDHERAGFVSRVFVAVFVVVVSSVVCLGLLQKRQTTAGTVVGNKYTRYSGLVSTFRP